MKFGKITQSGLNLSADFSEIPAQFSANIQIEAEIDHSYSSYVFTPAVGYFDGIKYTSGSIEVEDGVMKLPADAFHFNGMIAISFGFLQGEEFINTNPISFVVNNAPGHFDPLPAANTWQALVTALVDSYMTAEASKFIPAVGENGNWFVNGGDTGVQAQGPKGDEGEGATVDVGSVTTSAAGSNAEVHNSGTTTAAVFDFVIPRGPAGPAGAGVPEGGTEGQIIVKQSDGSTKWEDMPNTEIVLNPSGGLIKSNEGEYGIKVDATDETNGSGITLTAEGVKLTTADENIKGGIVGTAKTDNQTEPVGIGKDGKLYTAPPVPNGGSAGKYLGFSDGGPAWLNIDSGLSSSSTNPVQNKAIYEAIGDISTALTAILGV